MPSIYNSQLPAAMAVQFPELQDVIAKKPLPKGVDEFSVVQEIKSAHGMFFLAFAKHKKFDAGWFQEKF